MPKGLKRALKAARQDDSDDEAAAAEERDGKRHRHKLHDTLLNVSADFMAGSLKASNTVGLALQNIKSKVQSSCKDLHYEPVQAMLMCVHSLMLLNSTDAMMELEAARQMMAEQESARAAAQRGEEGAQQQQ